MSHGHWDDDFGGEPLDEDPEGPLEADLEAGGDEDEYDTLPCPNCGHDISELAQQCPHCGDWIVPDAGVGSKRKPLLVAIAIVLLIVFLLWVF